MLDLSYGAVRSIPEGIACAWGARWIWPNDLVWDRQSCDGNDEDAGRLIAWLNDQAIVRSKTEAARLAREYELSPADDRTVTLFEDERGIVVGNPQNSSGYLYVAAWLKPE